MMRPVFEVERAFRFSRSSSHDSTMKEPPMQVLLPPNWPRPKGYANGVVSRGRQVFVAGMIGFQYLYAPISDAYQNLVQRRSERGDKFMRLLWPPSTPLAPRLQRPTRSP